MFPGSGPQGSEKGKWLQEKEYGQLSVYVRYH